jgi:translation initiation factor IF-2
MSISISDLAKELNIAPEAVQLHAMDLDFEILEDEMISDEIAVEIKKIELNNELLQTEHEIEEKLEREIIDEQQKKTAGSQKKILKKKAEQAKRVVEPEKVNIETTADGTIILPEECTVRELAIKIDKPLPIVLVKLKQNGIIANLKENIDYETAAIIAEELNVKVKREAVQLTGEELFRGDLSTLLKDEDIEQLTTRPPVISIMGHVDHGKTSILDFIRKSKVVDQEAGGITQSIGAYQIDLDGEKMTFLDTPGHEAFTSMRARGARATDIAILVVAATEGLKPQSIEAINHAREAAIPVIVAINKMDLEGANPDLVKSGLAENDLTPEDWSGDTPCIEVSAKTGAGIDKLLETIKIVAELKELKANPNRPAIATVIESEMTAKSGIFATVLVNTGTLKKGNPFVIYDQHGKIRSMLDFAGNPISEASPSTPVRISGFDKLPYAGDLLQVMESEKKARKSAEEVAGIQHEDLLQKRTKFSLATMKAEFAKNKMDQLKVILKADSKGSLEAAISETESVVTDESFVKIIHSGVGEITESDVILAAAGGAIVIGFNVGTPNAVKKSADHIGIEILKFDVIYHLTEKLNEILLGITDEKDVEEILGEFKIKAIFASNKKMSVVGGDVLDGVIRKNVFFRQFRIQDEKNEEGEPIETLIGTAKIESVQLGQKEVHEIAAGTECGMRIVHKELVFAEGDRLELFLNKK